MTTTIAGTCGRSGFKDGPLGSALFNNPDKIGLASSGELFIFDKGNRYIRKLVKQKVPEGEEGEERWLVKTMINGACRDIEEIAGYSGLEWLGLDSAHKIGKKS